MVTAAAVKSQNGSDVRSATDKRIARSAVFQLVKTVRKDILFTGENTYTNIELVRKPKTEQVAVWDKGTMWTSPESWYNDSMLIFRFNVEHFVVSAVEHQLMKLNGIQRVVDSFWMATNGTDTVILGRDSKGDFYESNFLSLLNDDTYTADDCMKKVRVMCNRAENHSAPINQRVSVYANAMTLYGSWLQQNGRSDADLKKHLAK